jgi:hypothetical protein
MIEVTYIVLGCLSVFLNFFLAHRLYTFSLIIINIEDALEDCLDKLKVRSDVFDKILEKPIFFDSIEIRQVINVIKDTKIDLLNIGNILTANMEIQSGAELEEKDSQKEVEE